MICGNGHTHYASQQASAYFSSLTMIDSVTNVSHLLFLSPILCYSLFILCYPLFVALSQALSTFILFSLTLHML